MTEMENNMAVPTTITLPAGASNGVHNTDVVYPDEVSNLIGDNANAADAYHATMAKQAAAEASRTSNHHKPMDHLVAARRRNLCWSVSLLIFFLGLIAGLAVWRFQQQSPGDGATGFALSPSGRAAHAREVLNKHFHSQSKVIQPGCEATVLLMRHCEKHGPNVVDEDGNEHCSYVGMQRAQFLPTLFDSSNNNNSTAKHHARWPTPSYLFALSPDRGNHWNFRQYETLRPLSEQSQIDIELVKSNALPPKLYDLLKSGALCGKMAAVSWKHEYLPDLAIALGCGQEQGCPASYPEYSFDQVWQLKYVFSPPAKLYDSSEEAKLKAGQTWGNSGQSTTEIEKEPTEEDGDTTDDDDDDDDATRRYLQRTLRHQKKKRKDNEGWFVFGSVQRMGFDPLSFSNLVGDYPSGGAASARKWKDEI